MPVSSYTSLMAASTTDSFSSTYPPGNFQKSFEH